MDGSFLSQAEVVVASRQFVCVRLMTYENADEAKFLKSLFIGRSGELENTLFTILSPDGQRALVPTSRTPDRTANDAKQLAETMKRVAQPFGVGAPKEGEPRPLPTVTNVRLALNVAACDNQPLVLMTGDEANRKRLEPILANLAWSAEHIGQFVYAVAALRELTMISGIDPSAGLLVVQPERYGQTGKVLSQVRADATRDQLAALLKQAVALHQRNEAVFASHIREGWQRGVFWDTVIPVSDPMERQARQRNPKLPPP